MHKGSDKILALVIILFSCSLQAQTQENILQSILDRLADYTNQFPREEIYIQTDRNEYVAGEDLWFNVFLVDRKHLMLSDNSSIAYIEILNVENKPVIRKRILLKEGAGPGHMILPDTLNAGIYTFRAYTNQMKNYLPYNCFSKEIAIYSTLKNKSTLAFKNVNRPLPSLPDTSSYPGAMIRIIDTRPDSLEVYADNNTYGDGQGTYYLIIQTRGNPEFSGTFKKSQSRICIAKKLMSSGISQAVVFDERGFPVASRYFYIPDTKPDSIKINLKDSYGAREQLNIGLEQGSNVVNNLKASISVAPYMGSFSPGIDDYLVFGSEFNTRSGYFTENILKNLSEKERDSVLLRLKSNWIDWNEILSAHFPGQEYIPEKRDHFIYGFIPGGHGDTVLMCSPSSSQSFQYTRADGKGNFVFRIHADEEPGDLIFIPQNGSGEARPVVNSSFSDKYYSYSGRDSIRIIPSDFARIAVDYQVRRLFRKTNAGRKFSFNEPVKIFRIYGKPDQELKLSDYIELPTMYEIFLELVPGVSLRPRKQGFEMLMTDRINDKRIELKPTLMIDGVPVNDASLIAGLDPALVDRIEITSQKYLIGDYLFNGIVNVITKAADFSCIELPAYMTRVKYAITDSVPQFISPDYSRESSRKSRIPDYRNTLYWNPSFSTTARFWSCDNKMKYLISIEGVNEDGAPISLRKVFEVK